MDSEGLKLGGEMVLPAACIVQEAPGWSYPVVAWVWWPGFGVSMFVQIIDCCAKMDLSHLP